MKKLLLVSLLSLSLISCGRKPFVITLEAQTLPIAANISWNAPIVNASFGAADDYEVRMDNVLIGTTANTTLNFNIATLGQHSFNVIARNSWGAGPAATLNVNVVTPGQSGNVQIRKQ